MNENTEQTTTAAAPGAPAENDQAAPAETTAAAPGAPAENDQAAPGTDAPATTAHASQDVVLGYDQSEFATIAAAPGAPAPGSETPESKAAFAAAFPPGEKPQDVQNLDAIAKAELDAQQEAPKPRPFALEQQSKTSIPGT